MSVTPVTRFRRIWYASSPVVAFFTYIGKLWAWGALWSVSPLRNTFATFERTLITLSVSRHAHIHELFFDGKNAATYDDAFLSRVVTRGAHIVHVGASTGVFGLRALAIAGASGSLTCYEAHPDTFLTLARNIYLNQKLGGQVTIRPAAVSSEEGIGYITTHHLHRGDYLKDVQISKSIKVRKVSLQNEVLPYHIDLLHISALGSEIAILEGSADVLDRVHMVSFRTDMEFIEKLNVELVKLLFILKFKKFYVFLVSGGTLYYLDKPYPLPQGKITLIAHRNPEELMDQFGYAIRYYEDK